MEGQKFCFAHNPQFNEAAYRKSRRMLMRPDPTGDKSKSKRMILRDWLMNQRELDRIEANEQWQQVLEGKMPLSNWLRKFRARVFEMIGGDLDVPNITVSYDTGTSRWRRR